MKELKNYKSSNNNKILFVLPINKIEEVYLNECLHNLCEQDEVVDLLVLNNNLKTSELELLKEIINDPKVERKVGKAGENEETKLVSGKNKLNYTIEETTSENFPKLFNEAFNYSKINDYKWFTIIEHDDTLTKFWLKYFNLYSDNKKDYDVLVPLAKQTSPMGFVGFMNEASWVDGFSEVAGYFDLNLMLRFNCINICGSAFKVDSISKYSEEKNGMYKPMKESMKLNYSYEFLLRMIYNDLKFFTVPRLGYDCRINRTFDNHDYFSSKLPLDLVQKPQDKGGVSVEEYKFWTDLSKKEYFFDNDRNKIYQPA